MWKDAIRQAGLDDLDFLREMLFEAVYWRGDADRHGQEAGLAFPELAKLLAGWGHRYGDVGKIAVSGRGQPIGAAWYRFWNANDHSYGYIADDVPELGIGVVKDARSQGVGTALVHALLEYAHQQGIQRISLSVEKDNPALFLYQKFGFKKVGRVDESWTMACDLSDYRSFFT